jgi:hypothetical protein
MNTQRQHTQLLPQPGGGHAPPAIEQAITVRTVGSPAGRDDHSIWRARRVWSLCATLADRLGRRRRPASS